MTTRREFLARALAAAVAGPPAVAAALEAAAPPEPAGPMGLLGLIEGGPGLWDVQGSVYGKSMLETLQEVYESEIRPSAAELSPIVAHFTDE